MNKEPSTCCESNGPWIAITSPRTGDTLARRNGRVTGCYDLDGGVLHSIKVRVLQATTLVEISSFNGVVAGASNVWTAATSNCLGITVGTDVLLRAELTLQGVVTPVLSDRLAVTMVSEGEGTTTRFIAAIHGGGNNAMNDLFEHTWGRLEYRARQMLRNFRTVARFEETGDVLNQAAMRIVHVLNRGSLPESSAHYFNIGGQAIRRELIDLARKYAGPHGLGANHHSDRHGKAADDPGEPLAVQHWNGGKPEDLEQWLKFHECVENLPSEEHQVMHLRWYQGLSLQEIAQLLGRSLDEIRSIWRSIKEWLKKCCNEKPPM